MVFKFFHEADIWASRRWSGEGFFAAWARRAPTRIKIEKQDADADELWRRLCDSPAGSRGRLQPA